MGLRTLAVTPIGSRSAARISARTGYFPASPRVLTRRLDALTQAVILVDLFDWIHALHISLGRVIHLADEPWADTAGSNVELEPRLFAGSFTVRCWYGKSASG